MLPVDPIQCEEDDWLPVIGTGEGYIALPAFVSPDGNYVHTEWEPSEEEMQRLVCGARLCIRIMTGAKPLQPIEVTVLDPVLPAEES